MDQMSAAAGQCFDTFIGELRCYRLGCFDGISHRLGLYRQVVADEHRCCGIEGDGALTRSSSGDASGKLGTCDAAAGSSLLIQPDGILDLLDDGALRGEVLMLV